MWPWRRQRISTPAELRLSRLPTSEDFVKIFNYEFDAGYGNSSNEWPAAYEAYAMLGVARRAENDLKQQSFIQESDLVALRRAAWAAFDTAADLDRFDDELIKEVPAFYRTWFAVAVPRHSSKETTRNLLDSVQSRLVDKIDVEQTLAYLAPVLERRARLVSETRHACDVVAEIAQRAEWMRVTASLDATAALKIDEEALQLRRLALEHASELTVMLADSLAEVAGVEAPKPALQPLDTISAHTPSGKENEQTLSSASS